MTECLECAALKHDLERVMTRENDFLNRLPEWQPIETAPKDDMIEVLTWNGTSVAVATWAWDWKWQTSGLPAFEPTHWMPLPEPPEPTLVYEAGNSMPKVTY
jgi:hypothetical protein